VICLGQDGEEVGPHGLVVSQILSEDEGNPQHLLLVTQPRSRIGPPAFDTPLL